MASPTTAKALLARMSELDVMEPERDLKAAIYGPLGGGKTIFSGQLAQSITQTGRILYLDSLDGWVSMQQVKGLTKGMTRLRINDYNDAVGIADALAKNVKGFELYDTIIVDEATSIADSILDAVVLDLHDTEAEIEGKDYRPAAKLFMGFLNRLYDIEGLHIILVCHDRVDKLGKGEDAPTITSLGFPPKLGKEVAKRMHLISYFDQTVKGTEKGPEYVREVQAQPTRRISAKSRIGGMPLKVTPEGYLSRVVAWLDGPMESELTETEAQIEPEEDVDEREPIDDEPAYDVQD